MHTVFRWAAVAQIPAALLAGLSHCEAMQREQEEVRSRLLRR